MENHNNNPSVWFVCKFCQRAFQKPQELVRHKRADHLEQFLADVKRKRLERERDKYEKFQFLKVLTVSFSHSLNDDIISCFFSAANEPRVKALADAREDRGQNNDSQGLETVANEGRGTVLCPSGIINNDDSDKEEQANDNIALEESHDPKNKPTTCPICSKTFTCDRSYRLHKKFRHTVDRPFPCNYCHLTFKYPGVRHRHIFKFHSKQRRSKSSLSDKPVKSGVEQKASEASESVVAKTTNQRNSVRGQQPSSSNEMDDYQSIFGDARASTARKRSLRSTKNGNNNNCEKYGTRGSFKSKFATARMRPSMPRNNRRILRY